MILHKHVLGEDRLILITSQTVIIVEVNILKSRCTLIDDGRLLSILVLRKL